MAEEVCAVGEGAEEPDVHVIAGFGGGEFRTVGCYLTVPGLGGAAGEVLLYGLGGWAGWCGGGGCCGRHLRCCRGCC